MFQPLAGPSKDFIHKTGKGGRMKPQHVKKPHNDKADTTEAAIPEQLMSDDLRERIAKRAYELYLERGCRAGCDVEDWVDAEREILALPRVQA
jgi:hypothetical protein